MSAHERRSARRNRWEQLLLEEFGDEFARTPVVYWPCGAVGAAMLPAEEHGLQCVLGVDPLTTHEVCLRAVPLSGGIVHPPIYLAPAGIPSQSRDGLHARAIDLYPRSLWVSREGCERVRQASAAFGNEFYDKAAAHLADVARDLLKGAAAS